MSHKRINITICNECKKEVHCSEKEVFIGQPFAGWFHVLQKPSSMASHLKEYDFCCKECLVRFFTRGSGE